MLPTIAPLPLLLSMDIKPDVVFKLAKGATLATYSQLLLMCCPDFATLLEEAPLVDGVRELLLPVECDAEAAAVALDFMKTPHKRARPSVFEGPPKADAWNPFNIWNPKHRDVVCFLEYVQFEKKWMDVILDQFYIRRIEAKVTLGKDVLDFMCKFPVLGRKLLLCHVRKEGQTSVWKLFVNHPDNPEIIWVIILWRWKTS